MRLTHTGLVVELEDLKIKTRLTNEKFASVKREFCELRFGSLFRVYYDGASGGT